MSIHNTILRKKQTYESISSSTGSIPQKEAEESFHLNPLPQKPVQNSIESILQKINNLLTLQVGQMHIRKSINKINMLRFLGILRIKEEKVNSADEAEVFRKIFKVTQKGLNFDSHQYFLQLNASVMNNHLQRQMSPIERLKVNLYDDEKPTSYYSQNLPTESNHQTTNIYHSNTIPISSMQSQSNFTQKKKNSIRRRSCYCMQTGKQSEKGMRMDFLFPIQLIKNRIYMKIKKKQEQKVKGGNDKDLIISSLNKTFDLQEKAAAPKLKFSNTGFAQEQIPNQNNAENQVSSVNRSSIVQIKQAYNSSNSPKVAHLAQGRSQFSSQLPSSPKNGNGLSHSQTLGHQASLNLKPSEQVPLINPTVKNHSSFSESFQSQQNNEPQNRKSKIASFNNLQRNSTQDLTSSNPHTSNSGSQHFTPNQRFSIVNNGGYSSFKRSSKEVSRKSHLLFGALIKKQSVSQLPNNSLQALIYEKQKKLLAKLRFATKLVGINQKQQKKRLLQTDYYDALQDIDNNDDSDQEDNEDEDGKNDEKKQVLVKKIRTNDEINLYNAQVITQSIINSKNLRFNQTLNEFVDQRTKSQKNLVSSLQEYNIIDKQMEVIQETNEKKISTHSLLSPNLKRIRGKSSQDPQRNQETPQSSPFLIINPPPFQIKMKKTQKSSRKNKSHQQKDHDQFLPQNSQSSPNTQSNFYYYVPPSSTTSQQSNVDYFQNKSQQKTQKSLRNIDQNKSDFLFVQQPFFSSTNNNRMKAHKEFDIFLSQNKPPKSFNLSSSSSTRSLLPKSNANFSINGRPQHSSMFNSSSQSIHKASKSSLLTFSLPTQNYGNELKNSKEDQIQ